MKLVHPKLIQPLEWNRDSMILWSIENPNDYLLFAQELLAQSRGDDGEFVFSDNDAVISFVKKIEVIDAPLRVSPNDKRILAKLYSGLQKSCAEEYYLKSQETIDCLRQFLLEIEYASDAILDFDDAIDISGLFKLANLRIFTDENDLAGNLSLFLQNANGYLGIKVFVFFNLCSFLTIEQIEELRKKAEENSFFILLIENKCPTDYNGIKYIYDFDKCEI